jgi:hypothetical protein
MGCYQSKTILEIKQPVVNNVNPFDYFHKKLGDDVMTILYRKIHESKYQDCLIKINYFLKTYYCCGYKCGYEGRMISESDCDYKRNMCYSCYGLNKEQKYVKDILDRYHYYKKEGQYTTNTFFECCSGECDYEIRICETVHSGIWQEKWCKKCKCCDIEGIKRQLRKGCTIRHLYLKR